MKIIPDDMKMHHNAVSNMNFNLLFVSILAMVLMSGQASSTNWTIDNNTVYINDSNAYIRVSPHTLTESGDIIVNLISKKYTGNIDVIFGFDVPSIKPISAGLYNPTYSNVTKSYTCSPPNWYNYTLSPKQFNCWYNQSTPVTNNETNETTYINTTVLVFNHSFETANLIAKTAYWNETVFNEYSDVSNAFTKLNYDYGGMNTWYLRKDVPIVANQSKQLKVTVQVPIKLGTHSGKYWIAIKPSNEALATAILSGHLYVLDPWWNTSWGTKAPILLNNTGNASVLTDYQVNLNVTYDSDMNNNGSDLRPVNDTSGLALSYWLDRNNSVNGSYFNIWYKTNISASAWMNSTDYLYYSNPSAASASNGTNTFFQFLNFENTTEGFSVGTSTTAQHYVDIYSFLLPSVQWAVKTNTFPEKPFSITKWYYFTSYGSSANSLRDISKMTVSPSQNVFVDVSYPTTGYWGVNSVSTGIAATINTWHKVQLVIKSSNYDVYIDNVLASSNVAYGTGNGDPVTEYAFNNYPSTSWYIDGILVHKYASPEPTAQLGTEIAPGVISNSTSRTFTATWNITVNVTWYWNSTSIQTNNSVTSASYTNSSLINGTHNITATGTNSGGSASQTWLWTISPAQVGEAIREFIQIIII